MDTLNSKIYKVGIGIIYMPEVEIKVRGYKCNNCSYEWLPRSKKEKPLICPRCKSARWDKPRREKTKKEKKET